jgi:AcrR family transcriptional regulator
MAAAHPVRLTPVKDQDPRKTKAPKSEQTRTLILETALRLFEERGYDRTTMRAIAKEAGVSVGNAYYYFDSKEHLVQGFYDRIAAEHQAAVQGVLGEEPDFGKRLQRVLDAWLDLSAPYHRFASQFFKNAADPDSPLSPFSAESHKARDSAIAVLQQTLAGAGNAAGAGAKADPELAEMLPQLLWLYQMGIVLFWVYDRSPGYERTYRLVARTVPLIARTVALSRYRMLRPLVRGVKELLEEFLVPASSGHAPSGPSGAAGDR